MVRQAAFGLIALALASPALAQGQQIGIGFPRTPTVPGVVAGKPGLVTPTCPAGRTLVFVGGASQARCMGNPVPAQVHPSSPPGMQSLFCQDGFVLGYTPDGAGLCSNDVTVAQ